MTQTIHKQTRPWANSNDSQNWNGHLDANDSGLLPDLTWRQHSSFIILETYEYFQTKLEIRDGGNTMVANFAFAIY